MRFVLIAFLLLGLGTGSIVPAPQGKTELPIRLPNDLIDFFAGEWTGSGEFANGKKIEADVSFSCDIDNQWLVYRHTDRTPGSYKALGMWGTEYASKRFVMIVNDNFGGVRLFTSEGWLNGRIVFQKDTAIILMVSAASAQTKRERFTFERQANDIFKMTYETSDDGRTWRLGDYLIFRKKG
jgi:hypothetical protein